MLKMRVWERGNGETCACGTSMKIMTSIMKDMTT